MNDARYLLRIRLLDIQPEIWRRFLVPSDITLDRLHDVVQIVMGWTDGHLFEFLINDERYTEFVESPEDGLESDEYRLANLVDDEGCVFHYLYDLGDDWRHELVVEEIRHSGSLHLVELACLEGERACPPEDVGGVGGYFELCRALGDPNHEEHRAYIEWLGYHYDPEYFDIHDVNDELLKYLRWSRHRHLPWGG